VAPDQHRSRSRLMGGSRALGEGGGKYTVVEVSGSALTPRAWRPHTPITEQAAETEHLRRKTRLGRKARSTATRFSPPGKTDRRSRNVTRFQDINQLRQNRQTPTNQPLRTG